MKYITVGFRTDAAGKKFMDWLKSNGNLLNLAKRLPPKEGQEKGPIQITNIQASSVHEYIPRVLEHRLYEFAPVILEFRDQQKAEEFIELALKGGAIPEKEGFEDSEALVARALQLLMLLEPSNVAGIKYQREVGGI